MAFQQTTASDVRDLINVITSFAVAQGWTKVYDDISNTGQVGLSKGSCHVAIGEPRNSSNSAYVFQTFTDQYLSATIEDHSMLGALSTGLDAGNMKYWGHPGSISDTYSYTGFHDNKQSETNDLKGPFSNVWLYSNATGDYVHVVIQSTADQYSHFSFGNIDKKGFNQPDVGYVWGMVFQHWATDPIVSDSTYFKNDLAGPHKWGHFGHGDEVQLYIPDGVRNTAAGMPSGAAITQNMAFTITTDQHKTTHGMSSAGKILDYFNAIDNQLTTGGIPLTAIPVIYYLTLNNTHQYLGEWPDLRLVNIENLNPGQEIKFGSEVWQVFPMKRKTTFDETNDGASPAPGASTMDWGLAYKKVT